jgi:3-oxoacyl-[acyl-carrier-protein] synthase III
VRAEIKKISYYLPEQVVTNDDLKKENPNWDMELVGNRVGVLKRRIAREDETALDLSVRACKSMFAEDRFLKELVDGIIFCTQSEDYILPPNSCILHKELGLDEDVFAFDLNLACSGYVYGLALAQGLISSGRAGNILLVNADTYSKYINKHDRSVRVLFGDGAAVSWIGPSGSEKGIVDIRCSTYGKFYDKFIIPAGGCRAPKSRTTASSNTDNSGNARTLENIYMDGMGILAFINSRIPAQINGILSKNGLGIEDIDLFVFHQASKPALDKLASLLKIDPEKVYSNIDRVGNTVSASIPIAMKDAIDEGRVSAGDRVIICGFGAGLSWGTAIVNL